MAYVSYKYWVKRIGSDKVFKKKAFKTARNP